MWGCCYGNRRGNAGSWLVSAYLSLHLVQGANTVLFQVFMISVMENYERFHISEDKAKNCNHVLGGVWPDCWQ